jgi:hypothetical protein
VQNWGLDACELCGTVTFTVRPRLLSDGEIIFAGSAASDACGKYSPSFTPRATSSFGSCNVCVCAYHSLTVPSDEEVSRVRSNSEAQRLEEWPSYGGTQKFQTDTFHEYFHRDHGAGLGAGRQTGWTGIVAKLIELSGLLDAGSCWQPANEVPLSADRRRRSAMRMLPTCSELRTTTRRRYDVSLGKGSMRDTLDASNRPLHPREQRPLPGSSSLLMIGGFGMIQLAVPENPTKPGFWLTDSAGRNTVRLVCESRSVCRNCFPVVHRSAA